MKKPITILQKQLDGLYDDDGVIKEEGCLEVVPGLLLAINLLKEEERANDDPRFDEFYAEYPLKKSKAPAKKTWKRLKPDDEMFEKIMAALRAQKQTRQWQDKQYIPHPSTWLNQERWEDEVDTPNALPTDDKYAHLS